METLCPLVLVNLEEPKPKEFCLTVNIAPPLDLFNILRDGQVMAGRCAGKKLSSPADAKVRPMMEVVRGAVFNILKVSELVQSSCIRLEMSIIGNPLVKGWFRVSIYNLEPSSIWDSLLLSAPLRIRAASSDCKQ